MEPNVPFWARNHAPRLVRCMDDSAQTPGTPQPADAVALRSVSAGEILLRRLGLWGGFPRFQASRVVAAVRSILMSVAADGVTLPFRQVLSRDALVPTSWANSDLVSPERLAASRTRAAASDRSSRSAWARACSTARVNRVLAAPVVVALKGKERGDDTYLWDTDHRFSSQMMLAPSRS